MSSSKEIACIEKSTDLYSSLAILITQSIIPTIAVLLCFINLCLEEYQRNFCMTITLKKHILRNKVILFKAINFVLCNFSWNLVMVGWNLTRFCHNDNGLWIMTPKKMILLHFIRMIPGKLVSKISCMQLNFNDVFSQFQDLLNSLLHTWINQDLEVVLSRRNSCRRGSVIRRFPAVPTKPRKSN